MFKENYLEYQGTLDDDDLSETVEKQQLQDILVEVTPKEVKSTTAFADRQ